MKLGVPLAFSGDEPVWASSGKWCDTPRGSPLVVSVTFCSHHQRQKQGKLKFKSVVCEQNSANPVIKHLFCTRESCLFANSVEGKSVARVRVRLQRRKTVLVRIHSSVVIILRPRGMWASPRIVSPPISGQYLPVSSVTCDSTRLVFCSHSHLQEQHFIDSFPVQGKTWALLSIWCAFTAPLPDCRPMNRTTKKKQSPDSHGLPSMSNQIR